jgi:arylsulfatase A-like enzyme
VVSTPVIGTDLFATFLEAAGLEVPDPCDGTSLVPLLEGRTDEHVPLFWHYPNYAWHGRNKLGGAVREGRWKLIERYADGARELYDLTEDLGETRNLAAQDPARAEALSAQLHAWLKDTGAQMPTPVR